jgi:hypothetical protein
VLLQSTEAALVTRFHEFMHEGGAVVKATL